MAKLIAIYGMPSDPKAFDEYFFGTHIHKTKKVPGLRHYDVSRAPIATPAGPSRHYLVATLTFDDMAAIQAAFGTPEGQAAANDVANFATGGVEMMFFDTRDL